MLQRQCPQMVLVNHDLWLLACTGHIAELHDDGHQALSPCKTLSLLAHLQQTCMGLLCSVRFEGERGQANEL